LKQNGGVL